MDLKKILAYGLGPSSASIVSLFYIPLLTYYFTPDDIGRFAIFQSVSAIALLIYSLGLDQSYVREYHNNKDKHQLFKTCLVPGLFIFFLTLTPVYLLNPTIISEILFSIKSHSISLVVITSLFFLILIRFSSLITRMKEMAIAFSLIQLIPKLALLIFTLFIVILNIPPDFKLLISINLLSIIISLIFISQTLHKDLSLSLMKRINKKELKEITQYGIPLMMGSISFSALITLDKFLIKAFSNLSELGIYSISATIANVAGIFSSIFNTLWAPSIYKWKSNGSIDNKRIEQILNILLFFVTLAFAVAGIFSWLLTFILPPHYKQVQFILGACLSSPLFYILTEAYSIGIGLEKRSSYAMFASLIVLLINATLNLMLIPLSGAKGASIALAMSFWVFLILRVELSCKLLPLTYLTKRKLYATTLIILILNSSYAFYGENNFYLWIIAWIIFTLYFILNNIATINSLSLIIKEKK